MAAAIRRCSLRRPQEDQTFPRIAVAPDRDLVVGERDRYEQTISGNEGDSHSDLRNACCRPNLRTTTEQLLISFFAFALRTMAHQVSRQVQRNRGGAEPQKMPYKPTHRSYGWFNAFGSPRLLAFRSPSCLATAHTARCARLNSIRSGSPTLKSISAPTLPFRRFAVGTFNSGEPSTATKQSVNSTDQLSRARLRCARRPPPAEVGGRCIR
jgi:hypothetical protein